MSKPNKFGCDKCAKSGWLEDHSPCECLKIHMHRFICSEAKVSPGVVDLSRDLDLAPVNGPVPFATLIERRLALLLVADQYTTHAYIAASLWAHLELFVRFHNPTEPKLSFIFEDNIKNLSEHQDVLSYVLYPDASFAQKAFYEKANTQCDAALLTVPFPDKKAIFRFFNISNMADLKTPNVAKAVEEMISSLAQECHVTKPVKIKWLNGLNLDAWGGIE